MNIHNTFKCEGCGYNTLNGQITIRETMPGKYCPECGGKEKCGACGDLHPKGFMTYMNDAKNYICHNCKYDYKEVLKYIKPLNINGYRNQSVMMVNR